jgi:hypothetical protein
MSPLIVVAARNRRAIVRQLAVIVTLALSGCDDFGLEPACNGVTMLSPYRPEVRAGWTIALAGWAVYEDTGEQCREANSDRHYLVTWTSSQPNIATVDAWGEVTGLKPGVTRIVVTNERSGKHKAVNITVVAW